MDKTDMSLIQLLLQNSRLSYAELADKLNLSVNAVHKRIQALTSLFLRGASVTSQAILIDLTCMGILATGIALYSKKFKI